MDLMTSLAQIFKSLTGILTSLHRLSFFTIPWALPVRRIRFLLLFFGVSFLMGCNMPQATEAAQEETHLTQAFETVNARLTAVAARTPTWTVLPKQTDRGIVPPTSSQTTTPTTSIEESTDTSTPQQELCNRAAPGIPIDVTVPDDSELEAGEPFTKVWRLRNVGTCTWSRDYTAELFSGEPMSAPDKVFLPNEVPPGESVDISVDLMAPSEEGTYQGNWKLRNPSGKWFGIGPEGASPFWVRIKVLPTPTLSPTPITATPTATKTLEVQQQQAVELAVGDYLDLDSGEVTQEGGDLRYSLNPGGQPLLEPVGKARLVSFGADQPGFDDCRTAKLAERPVVVEAAEIRKYLCYKTDLGLPGRAEILSLNEQDATISLEILTWALP